MKLKVLKAETGKFRYIDFITFGDGNGVKCTISPLESEFNDEECILDVEFVRGDFSSISGLHILNTQFCGPDDEEIFVEGKDVYRYIDRALEFTVTDTSCSRCYQYIDMADGPIIADITFKKEGAVLPEFLGQIVDIFEDYLDDNGMTILNEDRDEQAVEAVENGDYETTEEAIAELGMCCIYGEDYDRIADVYRHLTGNWDSDLPKYAVTKKVAEGYSRAITEAFMEIMEERGVNAEDGSRIDTGNLDRIGLEYKVLDTFTRWGLCAALL